MERKKIARSTLTISLPDQVKEWVRKKDNYSSFIAGLLEAEMEKEQQGDSIVKPEEQLEKIVTGGMTKREILESVEAYRKQKLEERREVWIEQHEEATQKLDRKNMESIKELERVDESYGEYRQKFEEKEITIKDVLNATGLPYMAVYNKVLALLRKEGYKIV
jgi:hypothetical protein